MRRSRTLAINALLATLIVIFTFIPLMPIGVSLAALMLLPVLIAGQIESWRSALFAGTFLGIMSCIASFVIPSPIAGAFHNPIVSIAPRIFVGLVAWVAYKVMSRATKKIKSPLLAHTISSAVSAASAVLTNTGLVLSMIWAFYGGKNVGETAITATYMMGLISINFAIEIVVCTLLTPPIAYAIRKSLNKSRYLPAGAKVEPLDGDDTSKNKNIN